MDDKDKKVCPTCGRIVMGNMKMGMCKRCHTNMLHLGIILIVMFIFPLISVGITFAIVTPMNAILPPILPAAIVLDVVYIICTIIGIIAGVFLLVFLVYKLVSINKSL